jgi:nesprin-1
LLQESWLPRGSLVNTIFIAVLLKSVFLSLQEFFQSLESHMILTETFFRKISGLVVPREKQALEEILTLAQGVLKQAHRRGVALEYILEVGELLL